MNFPPFLSRKHVNWKEKLVADSVIDHLPAVKTSHVWPSLVLWFHYNLFKNQTERWQDEENPRRFQLRPTWKMRFEPLDLFWASVVVVEEEEGGGLNKCYINKKALNPKPGIWVWKINNLVVFSSSFCSFFLSVWVNKRQQGAHTHALISLAQQRTGQITPAGQQRRAVSVCVREIHWKK